MWPGGSLGGKMAMSLSVVLGLCAALCGGAAVAVSDSDHKFYTGATDVSVSTNLPTRES